MEHTITLKGRDRTYNIVCGSGIIQGFSRFFGRIYGTAAILTDSNVAPLYLDKLISGLAADRVITYVIPAGEQQKNLLVCADIYDFLAGSAFSRTDTVIALGGGVVGDIAGFAAATFLRGVPFYNVPTSLLAQVDSSVGGKCGVDIAGGKNLVGAFYQPFGVLCDTSVINTLPPLQYDCGAAETVKYAFIYDSSMLSKVLSFKQNADYLIRRSIEIKRDIVQSDEFDTGMRMILNFGHTIGHAAETLGGYSELLHGHAVAAGMAYAANLSVKLGLCAPHAYKTVVDTLKLLNLPVHLPYTAKQLQNIILSDKKVRAGNLNFILLEDIGKAAIKSFPVGRVGQLLTMALDTD